MCQTAKVSRMNLCKGIRLNLFATANVRSSRKSKFFVKGLNKIPKKSPMGSRRRYSFSFQQKDTFQSFMMLDN